MPADVQLLTSELKALINRYQASPEEFDAAVEHVLSYNEVGEPMFTGGDELDIEMANPLVNLGVVQPYVWVAKTMKALGMYPAKTQAGRRMDIAIKMQDEPNVPGAWMCEHLDIGPGSLQPGKVTFCPECAEKYEQGAALVHEDGHVLKPTAKGDWVKAAGAGQ